MVDNVNPTSQFHPYQPQDAVPHTDRPLQGGLGGILGNYMKNVDVRGQIDRARGMAQKNPSLVLGGLAALAIGMGMMRKRSMR